MSLNEDHNYMHLAPWTFVKMLPVKDAPPWTVKDAPPWTATIEAACMQSQRGRGPPRL